MQEQEGQPSKSSHTTQLGKSAHDSKHRKFLDFLQKMHYHYLRKPHLTKKR